MSRTLTDRFGAAPRPPAPPREERVRRIASIAHRLAEACEAEPAIPRPLAARAAALARELESFEA
jgi:hypothetical protein